ncbi:hypothetical protein SPRG_00776 [Saprolegnia parasitica CBS 223.65]|uniref:UDENN domain-containing protein n=1 Tax=Saprolegnia parasitica (strain CBS 223.65) TaxID=695850 RepID=A0A067CVL7_SAPPC|nr:hypothetical protein SPRG_00776 [Saprolegnia parasitica CBS 223.65]KDO34714.1 hypothetical protein SPRG_00776 [Saprolegnia parasitica CBS 223.65]|eukprot:XP_012194383.1 hypothetical protein SPRG_00776 [Saprolegnia parasitica CBS 223.65]
MPSHGLTVQEVVHDPHMHSVFLKYLSVHDTVNFSRLLFLVSVDEFKKLFSATPTISPTSPSSLRGSYAKKIIAKYMSDDSFFHIGDDSFRVQDQPIATYGTFLKNDLSMCSGLSSDADLFLDVQKAVITALEPSLEAFRLTAEGRALLQVKVSMIDTTVATSLHDVEVDHTKANFTLERVLSNRRLCCVFWVFLFKERSHGPLSFWMEATMRLLPLMDEYLHAGVASDVDDEVPRRSIDGSSSSRIDIDHSRAIVHLGRVLWKKYMAPHATAEVHVLCEGERALFDVLEHHISSWSLDTLLSATQVQQAGLTLRSILCYVKDDLQMNHFVRFLQSRSFQSMLQSFQHRLLSPLHHSLSVATLKDSRSSSSNGSSSGSSSDSSTTSLPELFHCMNVISHQPQRPRLTSFALHKVGGAPHCISGVLSFASNVATRGRFNQTVLYALANVYPQDESIAHHHTLPDHLESFLCPSAATIRSTSPPPPSLVHVVVGSTERPFYMVCLTRYVPMTSSEFLSPLEAVLLEQKSLRVYVAAGICVLSRYPLFDTLRRRLTTLHLDVLTDPSYNDLDFAWSSRHVAALTAPLPSTPTPFPASHAVDFSMQPLFLCLHLDAILRLFASLLLERKIVLISSHVSVLTTVAEACKSLLAPLQWPHVYAPLLPPGMLECLHCPTPYLFGVHANQIDHVHSLLKASDEEDEVVLVHLDSHEVLNAPMELPPPVAFADTLEPPTPRPFPQDAIRSLFRETWTDMMADMEEFSFPLSDEVDSMVVFDNVGFLKHRDASDAAFYQVFVKTQLFSQFVATNGVQ